jgi:NitT/TauT family transport system substrate-binding protein
VKYVVAMVVGAAGLTLAGCRSEEPQERDPLRVRYIPIAECVQLYVAQEMGFFEAEGLEVKLISLAGGARILDALNGDSLDAGSSNVVSLVLQRSRGSRFRSCFGATIEDEDHQNHAILVRSESILSAGEKAPPAEILRGRRIAVNTNRNIEAPMVQKYLATIGLTLDEVKLVEIPFPRMLPLLESGAIDAASIVEPFITIARNKHKGQMETLCNHYLDYPDQKEPWMSVVATYVTSEASLIERQDEFQRFRRAMTKATRYFISHEGNPSWRSPNNLARRYAATRRHSNRPLTYDGGSTTTALFSDLARPMGGPA